MAAMSIAEYQAEVARMDDGRRLWRESAMFHARAADAANDRAYAAERRAKVAEEALDECRDSLRQTEAAYSLEVYRAVALDRAFKRSAEETRRQAERANAWRAEAVASGYRVGALTADVERLRDELSRTESVAVAARFCRERDAAEAEVERLQDEVAQLKTSLALARAVLSKVVDALGEAS